MNEIIRQTHATGAEIEAIMDALEPVIVSVPRTHAMMALLSWSLILQNPDIETDALVEGVKGASQWIVLYVTGIGENTAGLDPMKVN